VADEDIGPVGPSINDDVGDQVERQWRWTAVADGVVE